MTNTTEPQREWPQTKQQRQNNKKKKDRALHHKPNNATCKVHPPFEIIQNCKLF